MFRHLGTRALFVASSLLLGLACDCEGDDGINALAPQIAADPNPLDFGIVHPGLTEVRILSVRNAGDAKLSVSSMRLSDDSHPGLAVEDRAFDIPVSGDPVAVEVRFTPGELGPASGKLLISSNDGDDPIYEVPIVASVEVKPGPAISVCVSSTEIPLEETCTDMPRIDFGVATFGQSTKANIRIRSVGDQPLLIAQGEPTANTHPSFSFNPGSVSQDTLAPGEERNIEVTFTPVTEVDVSGVFQIISNDLDREILPVILEARAVAPAFCADPSLVDFGTVGIGDQADRTVTLESCGEVAVDLSALDIAGGNPEFSVLNAPSSPVTLQPGETFEAQLRYAPTDFGQDSERMRIGSTLPDGFVNLIGKAATCDLAASPLTVNYGGVARNGSAVRAVLVENVGALDCNLTGLTIVGDSSFTVATAPSLPSVLAPSDAVTVDVQYAPSGAGSHAATLEIASDDPVEPTISVALSGRQLGLGECALVANPDPVNFGAVPLGTERRMGVQVTNTGTNLCTLLGVQMSAATPGEFRVSDTPTLPFITGGASVTIEVAFQPSDTQLEVGELEIKTSLTNPPKTVQLNASGSGAKLCVTPDPVVFGTHQAGIAVTRPVQLVSCGSDALTLSALSLSAMTSAEYQILNLPGLPLSLPAGSQYTLDVRYTGANLGRDDGHLVAVSNDGIEPTQNIQLVANTQPGPCGDVQGRICGLGGNGPAPGAIVTVQTVNGPVTATANENGDFVLTCVPPGNHQITASSGSWSTSFPASVSDGQLTSIPGQQCLDPQSAEVAVVWGQWDQMENILDFLNVPYTFYGQGNESSLLGDPSELAQYDIVFLNCGFDEFALNPGNLQTYVNNGGSLYASDYAYDAVERPFPSFIDFAGDDTQSDAAQGSNWSGTAEVTEATLQAALSGRTQVSVNEIYTEIDAVDPATTVYLAGDRTGNGTMYPFMVGFQPTPPNSGLVMFTTFHNNGQADILTIFQWLINQL